MFLQDMEMEVFATIVTYDAVVGSTPVWASVNVFNNNNQSDIVVVNNGTNNVAVLMDYFTKSSARQTIYHGGDLGVLGLVAVSDFNDDGILDIVFKPGHFISILIGLGNSTFDEQGTYLIDEKSYPQYLCTKDVNNDNRMDIVLADTGLDAIVVFLGYGNGTFGAMTSYSTGNGSNPWWVALGDLNNDSLLDMVSANYGSNSIGILLGNKNGSFSLRSTYSFVAPFSVAVDDVNNDNHLDIVVPTGIAKVFYFTWTR